jgi:hypothetical protein
VSVQPDSGGGSRRILPERPTSFLLADAARCAAFSRRGERSPQAVTPNASRSALNRFWRLASTAFDRRYTSASGMLIATGQTS